ncbi:hypothetical protein FLP10_11340 [Agromyces intestinalis]|uniref:HD domain-containing protein n=1 Tax=Agromyces intestinalis TaxID=2592652 RepID=A0A5C1YFR7_9MICO|nr:hypothetical protein [Agromyces intestinalis]QEO14944.1 hypothetical protein FLP10_11340 [Agromyces intestinalis]
MTSSDDAPGTAGAPATVTAGPLRPRRQAVADDAASAVAMISSPPAVPPADAPRQIPTSRRASRAASGQRYYLCCIEPSGEYVEVIVAVTDADRRRYFTTRDGSRLTEVDEGYFARRSTGNARSMLELDDREMGELEAELAFVRPVHGRDPLSEPEWAVFLPAVAAAAPAAEPEPEPEPEAPITPAPESLAEEASVSIESSASPAGAPDDRNWTIEEFEHLMSGTITAPAPAAAAAPLPPAPASAVSALPAPASAASAPPVADPARDLANQVALAKGIAFVAHHGQVDRMGAAYIDHPARLAERFDDDAEPIGAAVAWLHDVLERTDLTADDLLEAGVVPAVVEVVQLLTRSAELSDDAYYARIGRHPLARRVKLADLDDDTAPWRVRRLDYEARVELALHRDRARVLLGAA